MRFRKKNNKAIILLIIVLVTAYVGYLKIPELLKYIYPMKYENIILEYSKEYGLNPYLITAIIKVESGFNTEALSKKNAMGLMQIRESTGKWIAEKIGMDNFASEMLYQPETNIKMGCWYIGYLIKYYDGNVKLALAAYNGGQGNVSKWLKDKDFSDDGSSLKDIPFAETRYYIERIEKTYVIYENLYNNSYTNKGKE